MEKKVGDTFQGSLERSQLDRLLQSLTTLQKEREDNLTENAEEYMRNWDDIFHYFQTIRTSTANYFNT